MERPCNSDQDCHTGFSCDEGYCNEPSWCSEEDSVVHNIEGAENFLIWFQGFIEYVILAPG